MSSSVLLPDVYESDANESTPSTIINEIAYGIILQHLNFKPSSLKIDWYSCIKHSLPDLKKILKFIRLPEKSNNFESVA